MEFDFNPGDDQNPFLAFSQMFNANQPQADLWANAAEIAKQIADQEGAGTNVNPVSRSKIDELTRVAELRLAEISGVPAQPSLKVETVTPGEWATRSIEVYKPFFERFAEAIGIGADEPGAEIDPFSMMMGQVLRSLAPVMVATSAGTMIGHLGANALGQYDLPVPRPGNDILLVPENLDALAISSGAETSEVYLMIMIHEFLMHSVLSVEHVRQRLEDLFVDFAAAFSPNTDLMEDALGGADPLADLEGMSEQFNSPDAVLSIMRSPAHDLLVPQITALIAPILGFVDFHLEQICKPLLSGYEAISNSITENAQTESDSDYFMRQLLGIEMSAQVRNRGRLFIEGVVERAGAQGLHKLWGDQLDLPTVAEVDAPGLWLERIGHGSDDGASMFEVPDDISGLEDL